MLTESEFAALISVLQRAPILPAEKVGLEAIMVKLQPTQQREPNPPEAPKA